MYMLIWVGKSYIADTGLLVAHSFMDDKFTDNELYRDILLDRLHVNEGMLMENIVAQMLVSSGRKLYFFSRNDRNNAADTMEIDFLISKDLITSKHNIIPIEVKSGDRYTFTSLNKLNNKYKEYLAQGIILHTKDLKEEEGVLYLPLYMTPLL